MSDVRLAIDGKIYSGWKSVHVQRSIEQAAGGFAVEVSDLEPWPISAGSAVVVSLGATAVITGYVDRVSTEFSGTTHTLRVEGRDKTADLVDCVVASGTGSLANQNLLQIAETIARPFGVQVSALAPVGAIFPKFSTQPGDTAWAVIERAARSRGLLVTSNGAGNLIITKPSQQRSEASLIQGRNIKRATLDDDHSERFSEYLIRAQAPGSDDSYGESVSKVFGNARDGSIVRHRPLLIVADTSMDSATAKRRAQWEKTVREARGKQIKVHVASWTKTIGGAVWQPNEIVACRIPLFRIDGDMLVSGVSFVRSEEEGTSTELSLVPVGGFDPEPEGKRKEKADA